MSLPILGLALTRKDFDGLRDWISADDRALELQDFVPWQALDAPEDMIASWRTALAGHAGHLGIHGPFLGIDLCSVDPEARAVVQKRYLQGLAVCAALGATHMVIHSSFNHWMVNNRVNFPQIKPQMIEAAADSLAPVLARAAEIGCTLMLENCDDCDPQDRLDLIAALDHPNLMASIDTGHADIVHGLYGAPPVVDFIAAASGHLGHVHLQDVDGYADRHWHPGDGRIAWRPVFEALAALEEAPRLILEVHDNHARLPATVARLEAQGLAR
jgi:sugar phosphate isomerase/epimerase